MQNNQKMKIKKYSASFNRDFNWYLYIRSIFNFDGGDSTRHEVIYDKNGLDGRYAFFKWDSNGILLPTKHPNILRSLLKTKGSVNLHIRMYAQGRAEGTFPLIEFRAFCIKNKVPKWFAEAVENQKFKYYDTTNNLLKIVSEYKPQTYPFAPKNNY